MNEKPKYFGTMMSGTDALEFLDQIEKKIDFTREKKGYGELFGRMRERFAYQIDQAEPMKPKYHKDKRSVVHDYWTCRKCGCKISQGTIQDYCWKCGHALEWDSTRCLTGYKDGDSD